MWGATLTARRWPTDGKISIHAPRVGRDQGRATIRPLMYFNPRAPCGARLRHMLREKAPRNFNPRAPCGARHASNEDDLRKFRFQSTRPVWGATGAGHVALNAQNHFNPRAPCGARRISAGTMPRSLLYFNPRAPCGARPVHHYATMHFDEFQSTRPVWGATSVP